MIDLTQEYTTENGKKVRFLSDFKVIAKTNIYVALVEGVYRHYTQDGKIWQDKDKGLSLATRD